MAKKEVLKFSEEEISTMVDAIEYDLLTKPRLAFTLENKWNLNFPDEAGVYAIFEKGKFIYIGETSDLRERMGDIRRTSRHTLRKKIGRIRFKEKLEGNQFSDKIEIAVHNHMVDHLEFSFHALSFGRKEVEARIHNKHKEKLLNSNSLRGSKNKK